MVDDRRYISAMFVPQLPLCSVSVLVSDANFHAAASVEGQRENWKKALPVVLEQSVSVADEPATQGAAWRTTSTSVDGCTSLHSGPCSELVPRHTGEVPLDGTL